MQRLALREFCHSRAGDKGDNLTLSLIVYRPDDYWIIEREVTANAVRHYFSPMVRGAVERYELPNIGALNFVLEKVLGGGSTKSLRRDLHGKTLSGPFLDMVVEVPDEFEPPRGPF